MLEEKIAELTAAITALTAALTANPVTVPMKADEPEEVEKPKKTRKKKVVADAPVEPPVVAEVSEPAPAEAAPEEEAPTVIEEVPAMSKEEVGARLREIMQKLGDPSGLQSILAELGAAKLSDLPSEKYPTLLNKAEALVAEDA